MTKPMAIDGYRIRPARIENVMLDGDRGKVTVTIHEGRNRQIRKMAQMCGMEVTRLCRIQEGPLTLGSLPAGQWRYLEPSEIAQLMFL